MIVVRNKFGCWGGGGGGGGELAVALKDKDERNKMAKAIIGVMGNLNPHLRDVPDFQHKLWAQLFIMSNFDLLSKAYKSLLSFLWTSTVG